MHEQLICQVLVEEAVFETQLRAADQREALRVMVQRIVSTRVGDDRLEQMVNELLARERRGSNAQRNGTAMPHLYWGDAPESANCAGWFYAPTGVPFGAPGNELIQWFFCPLVRDKSCFPILGAGSQLLASRDFREQVARASNADTFRAIVEHFLGVRLQGAPAPLPQPMTRVCERTQIRHVVGIHARPSYQIANLASKFVSNIEVVTPQGTADAKSMFSLLSLSIPSGAWVEVRTQGSDAREALAALIDLLASDFDLKE